MSYGEETIKRGNVYFIRVDGGIGSMQGIGRPVVVLTSDFGCENSDIITTAYMTSSPKRMVLAVETHSTGRPSWVLCNQIVTVDKSMLERKIGTLTEEELKKVDKALGIALGLQEFKKDEGVIEKSEPESDISLTLERDTYKKLYEKAVEKIAEYKMRADVYKAQPTETKVNINTATENDFVLVGFSYGVARQIITQRNKSGLFKKVGDLLNVPGVGPVTLEKYESKLTI